MMIVRALILLAGLLVLPALDAWAQEPRHVAGPRSPRGVAVVDANGKQVGTVVEARLRDVTIALSVNGRSVLLDVTSAVSTEFSPGAGALPPFRGGSLLSFESRDCSGPPLMLQHPNRLLDVAAIAPPGLTLYLPAVPRAAPATFTWGSYVGTAGCQATLFSAPSDSLVPAVAVVDLLTLFTPPLRLRFVK
jgi:hypothetical protein